MRPFAVLAVLALSSLVLSGCSSGPSPQATSIDDSAIVVTRPDDYSADLNATNASKPHLHDYWGGQTRLVVMDGLGSDPQPGLAGGNDVRIQQWRPESGHVVPQGTARVEVSFNWTTDQLDMMANPTLWVKTAADNAPKLIGDIQQGNPLTVASTNEADDLPHQLLSAWVLEFHASGTGPSGSVRMKGEIRIHAVAVRGLEIPLYPGHPDRWDNHTDLHVVAASNAVAYMQDPGDAGCDGAMCPVVWVPADGAIVPPEAKAVVVWLNATYGSPTRLGLLYHGAEGRAFQHPTPTRETGNSRLYVLSLQGNADGPYAKQSQWEFSTAIEGPAPDRVAYEEVHIDVHVLRDDFEG